MKWKAFDRWATRQGYTFTTQGQGDESIVGVIGTTPMVRQSVLIYQRVDTTALMLYQID